MLKRDEPESDCDPPAALVSGAESRVPFHSPAETNSCRFEQWLQPSVGLANGHLVLASIQLDLRMSGKWRILFYT